LNDEAALYHGISTVAPHASHLTLPEAEMTPQEIVSELENTPRAACFGVG
jgi:hypothetical protein